MKIKEKVLKEVRNSGWSPELDVGMSYVEQAIDLTLAKVGKVIDERITIHKIFRTTTQRSEEDDKTEINNQIIKAFEELKQKLGGTN